MVNDNSKILVSFLTLVLLLFVVCFGLINLGEASNFSFDNTFSAPSFNHIFGTDNYGRDMATLTLSGLSISLLTALASCIISVIIALLVAIFTSSENKAFSTVFETLTNAILGIPHIVLMILVSFAFGKGALGVVAAVSLTHWPTLSRILSNELKQIKASNWYKIESSLTSNKLQLVTKHIIPNVSKQLFVGATLALPHAILHESTLTFLGFGFSPEVPAIGNILSETLKFTLTGNWWLSIFPGLTLIVTVILVSKLAERLQIRMEQTL